MNVFPYLLLLTLFILAIAAVVESVAPNAVMNILRQGAAPFEGFEDGSANSLNFWSAFTSRRHDVGDTREEGGYVRDPRYFSGYVDVSRLGLPYDFCRVVAQESKPEAKFFACALAGTENLSSTEFRTDSTAQGFRLSIDDYMNDTNGDGRLDYCRILRWKGSSSFQPVCALARDTAFDSHEVVDPSPPTPIAKLLTFYQGCVLWYRFHGDMSDMIGNTKPMIAGALTIDETPRGQAAAGLQFNGLDQFIRLTDTPYFALGKVIPLRSIRSWMVWVYFDEFTNNAKIFDFGNGSSADNVFLGILRKGDPGVQSDTVRNPTCETQPSTVPTAPSGAQPVLETTPKNWMETSAANVNDFTSGGFELAPRTLPPSSAIRPTQSHDPATAATLLYEVWDKQARKLQVKLNAVIPLRRWTHIAITVTSGDAFRPNLGFYINGVKVYEKTDGFLPATSLMTNCYLGKSNWASDTSSYDNSDELFSGRMFDFRAYARPLSKTLIRDSYSWGKEKLGLV